MRCQENLDYITNFCNDMLNSLAPTIKLAVTKELQLHINKLAAELQRERAPEVASGLEE